MKSKYVPVELHQVHVLLLSNFHNFGVYLAYYCCVENDVSYLACIEFSMKLFSKMANYFLGIMTIPCMFVTT